MKRIFLLIALISLPAFGQGVRYDSNVTTSAKNVPVGAQAAVMTLPYSKITVCAYDGTTDPCVSTSPIYSDEALTQIISQPMTTDSQGRFGFWIAAGVYKYSVQTTGGTYVGTYALSLDSPQGPQGPGGIGCGTGNCVVTGSLLSQNITVVNNVEDASLFAGADIGAKINAAFAACPVTQSCKVILPPGNNYSYSTMFTIPGSLQYTALDCQGSALTFTGTGDASQVAQRNDGDPTGEMSNCRIINGGGNTSSLAAVHQFSRIWFAYNNNTFYGFNNAGGVGIELDNNAGDGWPGYNERTHFYGNSFSLDTKGIQFKGSNGGTNSFARQVMIGTECALTDGQICMSVEGTGGFQSSDVYGGIFTINANLTGNTIEPRIISITDGGDMRLGFAQVEGEAAGAVGGYQIYIDDSSSSYVMSGAVSNAGGLTNFNGATSDAIATSPLPYNFVFQGIPFANGGQEQALNPKILFDGTSFRYGVVRSSGTTFDTGDFQLFGRITTNPSDPEVDAHPSTGNTQRNLFFCNFSGCGFGLGYGLSATTGGTNIPTHDLEFKGTFANQAGTSGTDADGTTYAVGLYINMHSSGAVINTAGFGYNWDHLLSTTAASDKLVLNVNTPSSSFATQAMIINAAGNITIPAIKAATGKFYVCVDTAGNLTSQAAACD